MTTKPRENASPVLIVGSMAFDDLDLPSGSEKDVVGGSATYAAYSAALFAPVQIVAAKRSTRSSTCSLIFVRSCPHPTPRRPS